MDLAVFTAAHEAEWRRLDDLVKRRRRLSGAEIDEMVALYQQTTTHLSTVRSAGQDPVLVAALSSRVARARAAVVGANAPGWGMVGRFALISFPAMAYRARWWWLGTAAGSVLVAFVIGWWVARSGTVQAAILPPGQVGRVAIRVRQPCLWKRHGTIVPLFRQPVDDRPARIAEAEQLGDLVVRLPCRIVARAAQKLVLPWS